MEFSSSEHQNKQSDDHRFESELGTLSFFPTLSKTKLKIDCDYSLFLAKNERGSLRGRDDTTQEEHRKLDERLLSA